MNAVTLPALPTSPRHARRLVGQAAVDSGCEELGDAAMLLVSELVTNALLHAGSPTTLVIQAAPGRCRVEVHDHNPSLPTLKGYSRTASTGRGLQLVDRIAAAWGAAATKTGKCVWFEVDASAADGAVLAYAFAGDLSDFDEIDLAEFERDDPRENPHEEAAGPLATARGRG